MRNERYVYEKVDGDEEQELTSVDKEKFRTPSKIEKQDSKKRVEYSAASDKNDNKDFFIKTNIVGGGTKKKKSKAKKSSEN